MLYNGYIQLTNINLLFVLISYNTINTDSQGQNDICISKLHEDV